jgi:choline dehydrogenase-like flavoprotein
MRLDGRAPADGEVIETDVCIVGSGPAGMTVATVLDRAGVRVCMVESGARPPDPADRDLAAGESVGHPYDIEHSRMRAVGGNSNHWLDRVFCRPLDPIDFEARAAVAHSGWPISRVDLDPFYVEAHELLDLGPFRYEADDWRAPRDLAYPFAADPRVKQVPYRLAPGDMFAGILDGLERSSNVTLLERSTAREVETAGAPHEVSGISVVRDGGRMVRIRARRYVIAGGGIENARLLLLSRGTRPNGLGNDADLVGRHFMEHIAVRAGLIVGTPGTPLRAGRPTPTEFEGHAIRWSLGLAEDVRRREHLLNGIFWIDPLSRAAASDGVASFQVVRAAIQRKPRPAGIARQALRALVGFPNIARTIMENRSGKPPYRVLQMMSLLEQVPNPDSRVTLGEDRDRFGDPVARLDWRTTAMDHESAASSVRILDEAIRASGQAWIERRYGVNPLPDLMNGGNHHLGTTRMSTDPATGVVDPDGRVHGMANLYVAGSSVFPTGGYVNPTLTITALALRLGRHLVEDGAASA